MDVRGILEKLGYKDLVPADWYTRITEWREWYKGETDFHKYTVYNGTQFVGCKRKSLKMAKMVAEDKADLLLNEKVTITVTSPNAQGKTNPLQDTLDLIFKDNAFWTKCNQLVELTNALGTGAFVEFKQKDKVMIDYIAADCVYPLSWGNRGIIDCAFASCFTDGTNGKRIYINRHLFENGKYVVYNDLFDEDGKRVDLPEGVLEKWPTGSSTPLFQIITPNIANNLDPSCPMGVSIYGNALDALESADLVYDSYYNEFKLGKKRIFVDGTVLKIDTTTGEPHLFFDPNDTTFYNLPSENQEGGKAITESNMELRVDEHQRGLQDQLDIISEKCGFGRGYYKFDGDQVKTATEVISQNSKLYRKIRKDEILLEDALIGLVRAVLWLSGIKSEFEVSVNFDDSIIEDTKAKRDGAMLEFNSGLIDEVQYHMITRNMDEDAAIEFVNKMRSRTPVEELPPDPDGDGADGSDSDDEGGAA